MGGPNPVVLQAQGRVCTGPHQSRPLGDDPADGPTARLVLETIVASACGELAPEERVSMAQLGAFFTAMTLRRGYGASTGWSEAERAAFVALGPALEEALPPEVLFLREPSQRFEPQSEADATLAVALGRILRGEHLDYDATRRALAAVMDPGAHPALRAAVLIGQRMNLESYDEVRGYLDATFPPEAVVTVELPSLTHLGEPYDGNLRSFRPTVFVAAVRAALGRPTVLHGVDVLAPKRGVTDEQIVLALGGSVSLDLDDAARALTDEALGLAYVSQRRFAPAAHALGELRAHIKKRPPLATTEKAQQLLRATGRNDMVIGYFHGGYEGPLLRLLEERGLDAGAAIKGEEGTTHPALRLAHPSTAERPAINRAQGFVRSAGVVRRFAIDLDPEVYGLSYGHNPREPGQSATQMAERGRAALAGERGPVFDRILLSTAATDHLLGYADSPAEARAGAEEAMRSGAAGARLDRYLRWSRERGT